MVARAHQIDEEDDGEDLFDPNLDPDRYEGVHIVTSAEEARALFDQAAQKDLGISGEEFLRRFDSGLYRGIPDTAEGRRIAGLIMLLPFARPTSF
jgi:hypothetical protein